MALPVTRPFSGVAGTIPTADEVNWTYNRDNTTNFVVDTAAPGFIKASTNGLDTGMRWTGDSFNTDHYSEVVLGQCSAGVGLGSGYGVGVRMDTSGTLKTMYRLIGSVGGWELSKFINGAYTPLASASSPAFATGDRLRLSMVGSVFTMTKNDVIFGTPPTDGALTTGVPGVAFSSTGATGDGIDSWSADNVDTLMGACMV